MSTIKCPMVKKVNKDVKLGAMDGHFRFWKVSFCEKYDYIRGGMDILHAQMDILWNLDLSTE